MVVTKLNALRSALDAVVVTKLNARRSTLDPVVVTKLCARRSARIDIAHQTTLCEAHIATLRAVRGAAYGLGRVDGERGVLGWFWPSVEPGRIWA